MDIEACIFVQLKLDEIIMNVGKPSVKMTDYFSTFLLIIMLKTIRWKPEKSLRKHLPKTTQGRKRLARTSN